MMESYCYMMLGYVLFVVYVRFGYLLRKYLVDK